MAEPPSFDTPTWVQYALALLRWSGCRNALSFPGHAAGEEIPLIPLRQKKIDSLYYLATDENSVAQRVYQKVWLIQRRALMEFCTEFSRHCEPPVVLKGADALDRYFGSNAVGFMGDCDLLVKRSDIVSAKIVLAGLGYRPAVFDDSVGTLVDRDIIDISTAESHHYELVGHRRLAPVELDEAELAFARTAVGDSLRIAGGQPVVVIELDIHHSVATDVDPSEMLERARPGTFDHARALTAEDNLWFLLGRYYAEVSLHGKQTLRDFGHIAALLGGEKLRWPHFVESVHEHGIEIGVFYFLSLFRALLGAEFVPAEVLAELSPNRYERSRDWGWQLGKLFGFVEPMPVLPGVGMLP